MWKVKMVPAELVENKNDGKPVELELAEKGGEEQEKEQKPVKKFSLEWFGFRFTEETHQAPKLPFYKIYWNFFVYGCRAFGGPVAQINMMKDELVIEKKWITLERFNRVFAVYQILPGPEATELACYFGMLSGGRLGALMGGLGFVTPGILLMLLWSWLYVEYGNISYKVGNSFHCLQVVVSAYILRANYKLAEGILYNKTKKEFDFAKGSVCLFCFLTATSELNFFISLAISGIMNAFFESAYKFRYFYAYFVAACTLGFYYLYVNRNGPPNGSLIGASTHSDTTTSGLFTLGLIAGCVSFGGAYTTLPFIYTDAVGGGWLTNQQFLDSLAITNILPTPLVTFVTMVGFIGGGIAGAIVMTIGIFLPAFSFTIIGHPFFEALVDNHIIPPFLDGVAAAVIGLLTVTALVFLKNTVLSGLDAAIFALAFFGVFHFTDKYAQPIGIIVAAIAGQILYH